MKKTLITLLAIGGIAMGTPQEDLASAITAAGGYNVGDEFTLTFSITSNSFNNYITRPVLTLSDSWHISSQAGNYLGFSKTVDGCSGNLTTSEDTYTSENTSETVIGEVEVGEATGWFYATNIANLTFEVTEDSLKITKGSTSVADLTFSEPLNLNSISIGEHITGISGLDVSVTPAAVPEPTTATLSLLALAGLAARRRRR